MRQELAEVLARETSYLTGVPDVDHMTVWRRRVVGEVMSPHSPYSYALRLTTTEPERTDFLDRWRCLIAEAVARLLGPTGGSRQLVWPMFVAVPPRLIPTKRPSAS